MSILCLNWVWLECRGVRGNNRLVLLALADEANDDGYCFPSFPTIARKAEVATSTAVERIKALEQDGRILVHRPEVTAPGRFNEYLVVMDRDADELRERYGWPAVQPTRPPRRRQPGTTVIPESGRSDSGAQDADIMPRPFGSDRQEPQPRPLRTFDVDNSDLSVSEPRDTRARAATFAELAVAIDDNFGSSVRTDDLDESRKAQIADLAARHGVPTLVAYALEVSAGFYDPPRSIRAFHRQWLRLPPWCGSCDVSRWHLDDHGTPATRCSKCHPDAQQPSTEAVSA